MWNFRRVLVNVDDETIWAKLNHHLLPLDVNLCPNAHLFEREMWKGTNTQLFGLFAERRCGWTVNLCRTGR